MAASCWALRSEAQCRHLECQRDFWFQVFQSAEERCLERASWCVFVLVIREYSCVLLHLMACRVVQGVPFSVSGTVDLLALFRCISCRFKFTTDVTDPSNMVGVRKICLFALALQCGCEAETCSCGCRGLLVEYLLPGRCAFHHITSLHLDPGIQRDLNISYQMPSGSFLQ